MRRWYSSRRCTCGPLAASASIRGRWRSRRCCSMLASGVLRVSNLTNFVAASASSPTRTSSCISRVVARRPRVRCSMELPPAPPERAQPCSRCRSAAGAGSASPRGWRRWSRKRSRLVFTRRAPRRLPGGTVVLAAGLAILAAAAAGAFPSFLAGAGAGGRRAGFVGRASSSPTRATTCRASARRPARSRRTSVRAPMLALACSGVNLGPPLRADRIARRTAAWSAVARGGHGVTSSDARSTAGSRILVGVPAMLARSQCSCVLG